MDTPAQTAESMQNNLGTMLEARGVSRRSFMQFCAALAVSAGLSATAAPRVAQAVEASVIGAKQGKLFPVLWIEGASCTGCTESFAQVETPDPGTVVLELISLNYSDVMSAGAGESLELAMEQTIEVGNYLLVYEGAVVERWGCNALRVGGEPGLRHLERAARNAKAIVALGSCAVNGGWMAAAPNAAGATGVQDYLKRFGIKKPIVNVPGCPANPEWLMAVLTEVIMLGENHLKLNAMNKPAGIYNQTVHDNCERRGHFENGEFVYEFGSKEEELGYCLYPLGCRGPQTNANCGVTMWNNRRSWCIQAGAPCIGCCEANPDNPQDNWVEVNTPFISRHRDIGVGPIKFQPTTAAVAATGALAAALAVHALGMKKLGRMDGGADFERKRHWDEKHPDKAIGDYNAAFQPEDSCSPTSTASKHSNTTDAISTNKKER